MSESIRVVWSESISIYPQVSVRLEPAANPGGGAVLTASSSYAQEAAEARRTFVASMALADDVHVGALPRLARNLALAVKAQIIGARRVAA